MSDEFQKIQLDMLADITMGQSPDSINYNDDEKGLPFLQGCADFGFRYPNPQTYVHPPLKLAKKNSILVSVRAPVGKINWSDRDYCIGRGLCSVKAKEKKAETSFLKYTLIQNEKFLHRRSQGSTFLAISFNDLSIFPVPDITVNAQKKIALILETLDQTIEKTEALIHKYQQVKQGLMHDLFTRGVTPDGILRPVREQAPELYKETPIGWIPHQWDVVQINNLCSDVVDCPHSTPVYKDHGIPCIRTADMKTGQLLTEQAYKVDYKTYLKRIQRLVPKAGDIIYSREGERLGIASPVGKEIVCLGQRVMLLRPSHETDPDFLLWSMNLPTFYRQVVSGLGATTSPHVNVGDIKKIMTCRPQKEEQEMIGKSIATVQIKLKKEEHFKNKLSLKKSGLMHDLLTGKVRVRVEE